MKKIAIQGVKGCFHHAAVSRYFEGCNYKLMECSSFREVAVSVAKSNVDIGVMAIENTIAGTILTNYSLLSEYNLKIVGEIYIPIQHHLMAYPGQKIEDIKEIYSHSMAILQCELFIDAHPFIKISEYSDTAAAAKYISICKKKGLAAIASENAAKEYGLEIISKNIQTITRNFTRFFIIKNCYKQENASFNKASLRFKILHTTGSLSQILSLISSLGINMTKIQSIPIIQRPWEYSFYVDIIFNNIKSYEKMKKCIQKIPCLHKWSIMGEYQNGRIRS
ncbi:prephenate dehydratase [Blattabacterium sp. (Blattella germanica) str. Bge]|uniref:prephenate dehydratase n=1 Tax=Blattabacterium sp. (Blattella germanica) TaxID=624186 RepID=UPI0001BB6196|nr:prephenate dehydratase [Blattabacterium sp. (Blattella germanica)]ACY40352.1 prephenate dehydratase [Blattabacterium sp. (Blattella germanica) str. Bge]